MTIAEIVREAAREHLSYGEYVRLHCSPGPPPPAQPAKPARVCCSCGCDISTRWPSAKYCIDCADRAYRDRRRIENHRQYAKRKARSNL